MISKLLLNHIHLGEISINEEGVITPMLKTYIVGGGYCVEMTFYHIDFGSNNFSVMYFLTDIDNNTQDRFEFNSSTEIDTEKPNKYYQVNEL